MNKIAEGIWLFPRTKDGGDKRGVCVMGSVHGNERIGASVIESLKEKLQDAELLRDVYLVFGNPEAYKQNVRFVDYDLNRLFGEGMDLKTITDSNEGKRAAEIQTILWQCDFLLDIHSTIKPSEPFVYCEPTPQHLALAELMNTQFIVSAAKEFRPADLVTSADNFIDRIGGFGITYESGWHKDAMNIDDVLQKAMLFLQETAACNFGLSPAEESDVAMHLVIHDHVIPESDSFSFVKDFSNFDRVKAGEIIGTGVVAERDSFIIFPKRDIRKGKIACYLAHME